MADQVSELTNSLTYVEWMWKSDSDQYTQSQSPNWSYYSDVENLIIEEAFLANKPQAILDNYYIDLKGKVQISNKDNTKQRSVQRTESKRVNKASRGERFMLDPIAPKRPFGSEYGWVSPFILETRMHLQLQEHQLPSKDETIIPMIVEKAAFGINEEGKKLGKQCEAEFMAKKLMNVKEKGMKEVWKCCAHLYSLNGFLFKKLNEIMRMIGSYKHEDVWRSKINTLGPFCLLLWDDPFNIKPNITKKLLYRGCILSEEQIATYIECSKHSYEYRSFQAFTSSSRNRDVAEMYGVNVLLIMEIGYAYTMNIQPFSQFSDEEEELIIPNVCFTVQRADFDASSNKHLFYLKLEHRFNKSGKHELARIPEQSSSDAFSTFIRDQNNDGHDSEISGHGGFLYKVRRGLLSIMGAGNRRPHCFDRDGCSLVDPITSNLFPLAADNVWEENHGS